MIDNTSSDRITEMEDMFIFDNLSDCIVDFHFMSAEEAIQRITSLFGATRVAEAAMKYDVHVKRSSRIYSESEIVLIARPPDSTRCASWEPRR